MLVSSALTERAAHGAVMGLLPAPLPPRVALLVVVRYLGPRQESRPSAEPDLAALLHSWHATSKGSLSIHAPKPPSTRSKDARRRVERQHVRTRNRVESQCVPELEREAVVAARGVDV